MDVAANVHNGLAYRKKFKCPICGEYAGHVSRTGLYQCKNGCRTSLQIDKILTDNDFKEFFTTAELEEFFEKPIECKENKEESSLCKFSRNEIEMINKLIYRTVDINNALDDEAIKYFKCFPDRVNDKERILNDYDCLFNLVEDISVCLNWLSKDISLIDVSLKIGKGPMFNPAYFYENFCEHFYSGMERIVLIIGIIFKIPFQKDKKLNNRDYFLKLLKKCTEYKSSKISKEMTALMSNNIYQILNADRASYDHDLSYNTNKDIDKNKDNEKDRFLIDQEMILPKIKGMVFVVNTFYNILTFIINHLDQLYYEKFDINAINMIRGTGNIEYFKVKENTNLSYILDQERKKNYNRLINFKEGMTYKRDIMFRVFEIIKSCYFAYGFSNGKNEDLNSLFRIGNLDCVMDRQYLIYSAAARMYACYDKIARCFCDKYNITNSINKMYFENFTFKNSIPNDISAICNKVLKTDEFKFLSAYRNEIVHIARKGCVYLDAMDNYEDYLLNSIIHNLQFVSKLFDTL